VNHSRVPAGAASRRRSAPRCVSDATLSNTWRAVYTAVMAGRSQAENTVDVRQRGGRGRGIPDMSSIANVGCRPLGFTVRLTHGTWCGSSFRAELNRAKHAVRPSMMAIPPLPENRQCRGRSVEDDTVPSSAARGGHVDSAIRIGREGEEVECIGFRDWPRRPWRRRGRGSKHANRHSWSCAELHNDSVPSPIVA
jgi:hypothetical protein